jgi:hypothetical protein
MPFYASKYRDITAWITAWRFRARVNRLATKYGLDRQLDDLTSLKRRAKSIVKNGLDAYYLSMLDPEQEVSRDDGVVCVLERWFGYALHAFTLARHFVPKLDERITMIVANGTGTHLYEGDHELVNFMAGAIHADRLADPGNRYENACLIIKEFTGIELDYRLHVGRTSKVTATKNGERWEINTTLHPLVG